MLCKIHLNLSLIVGVVDLFRLFSLIVHCQAQSTVSSRCCTRSSIYREAEHCFRLLLSETSGENLASRDGCSGLSVICVIYWIWGWTCHMMDAWVFLVNMCNIFGVRMIMSRDGCVGCQWICVTYWELAIKGKTRVTPSGRITFFQLYFSLCLKPYC